jgi:hypothetical protein
MFSICSGHEQIGPYNTNTLIVCRVTARLPFNVDRVVSATMSSSRKKSPRLAVDELQASTFHFEKLPALKYVGNPLYRSRYARDLACMLDLDPDVASWTAPAPIMRIGLLGHVADFRVIDHDGAVRLLDACDRVPAAEVLAIEAMAVEQGGRYRLLALEEIYDGGFRLRNARDLLKYANTTVTLADRVRLLALLDQEGSLPMADCFTAIRNTEPVAAIASLILHRHIEVELDEALLGPETMVRRIRL